MTLTVAPETPVTVDELAPFTARNGDVVKAGCYGVSHGSGLGAELIRHATESWAGHAFVYIGNGRIIEAMPPRACISSVDSHPDGLYNAHEDISDEQRLAIIGRAQALVGTDYDWPAYVGFALEVLKIRTHKDLDPMFAQDKWRVCSALVDDCYKVAGIDLEPDAAYPNLVSPADLYNRIAQLG